MGRKNPKKRLDKLLVDMNLAEDLQEAGALIMSGRVLVNSQKTDKPGSSFSSDAVIEILSKTPYVGRGGIKLAGALDEFNVSLSDKICADVGSSTGGFTEVMLMRGAAKVYSIDIAYGELDWKLRKDNRVVVMERTNATRVETLPEPVDFISIDLSLLSIKKILPNAKNWLKETGDLVALIKPQYEASPEQLPPGAVITDPAIHKDILLDILDWVTSQDLFPHMLTRSEITGKSGNQEFFIYLRRESIVDFDAATLIASI